MEQGSKDWILEENIQNGVPAPKKCKKHKKHKKHKSVYKKWTSSDNKYLIEHATESVWVLCKVLGRGYQATRRQLYKLLHDPEFAERHTKTNKEPITQSGEKQEKTSNTKKKKKQVRKTFSKKRKTTVKEEPKKEIPITVTVHPKFEIQWKEVLQLFYLAVSFGILSILVYLLFTR